MITERMQQLAGVPLNESERIDLRTGEALAESRKINENKESVIKKHLYDTGTGISNIGDRYMFVYDDWEFRGFEPDDIVEEFMAFLKKTKRKFDPKLMWKKKGFKAKPAWRGNWS
jgi:hypothetical protein